MTKNDEIICDLENKDYFIEKLGEEDNSKNNLEKYKAKQFIEIIKKATPLQPLT